MAIAFEPKPLLPGSPETLGLTDSAGPAGPARSRRLLALQVRVSFPEEMPSFVQM